ncbi:MAG: chemotaxis protein CheA [Sphingobacteriales bacterium]|nr:MAG: chemotaxis protein CheA [Sphingobacteriales bacterium]
MKDREKEYREIFIAEALEEFDAINRHITTLEKEPEDDKILAEIFRLLHNLKANAKATGYLDIAQFSHKLESVFGAIRNKDITFTGPIVGVLFEAIDTLGRLLTNLDNPEKSVIDAKLDRNLDSIINNLSGAHIEETHVKHYHTSQNIALSDLIYIPIRKLDDLMNLVGELIIDRDRVLAISKEIDSSNLKSVSAHLYRIANEIQQTVMDARLVNIGFLFNKFPRIVRDIAVIENKHIELEITGQDIQIDRNILQILTDSLLHLVRNAITHGIESAEKRKKNKKDETGHLTLSAQSDKDTVLIQIIDDGQGIDVDQVRRYAIQHRYIAGEKANELSQKEMLSFIFEPGFSLSKEITEFSGRGVGLDVVKNAIDSLGGRISVESQRGEGTTFNLYVPTSIAVKGALLFEVAQNFYAIPLIHTDAVVTLPVSQIHHVGRAMLADIKGETLPLIDLAELFDNQAHDDDLFTSPKLFTKDVQDIVIVSYNNRKLGLIVDRLLRQQDIVVKPLQKPVDNVDLFGGVTLLGSGEICLVLDVPAISRNFIMRNKDLAAPANVE